MNFTKTIINGIKYWVENKFLKINSDISVLEAKIEEKQPLGDYLISSDLENFDSQIDSKIKDVNVEIDKKANEEDLLAHTSNTENPHNVTAEQAESVSYREQILTDEQKLQARENIGAGVPLPEVEGAHMQFVTDSTGEIKWEKQSHHYETLIENVSFTRENNPEFNSEYFCLTNDVFPFVEGTYIVEYDKYSSNKELEKVIKEITLVKKSDYNGDEYLASKERYDAESHNNIPFMFVVYNGSNEIYYNYGVHKVETNGVYLPEWVALNGFTNLSVTRVISKKHLPFNVPFVQYAFGKNQAVVVKSVDEFNRPLEWGCSYYSWNDIMNKPFGEISKTYTVWENAPSYWSSMTSYHHIHNCTFGKDITFGDEVLIICDGTEYHGLISEDITEFIIKFHEGASGYQDVGHRVVFDSNDFENTYGEIFVTKKSNSNDVSVFHLHKPSTNTGTYTMSAYITAKRNYYIDEAFIPDTIARKTDVLPVATDEETIAMLIELDVLTSAVDEMGSLPIDNNGSIVI